MTSSAKAKGDRGEREAIGFLVHHIPDLLVDSPQRRLGLGRHEDTGDLDALPGTVIQVKSYADPRIGVREAVRGADVQAKRAGVPLGVGMVSIPRKPRMSVGRWVFCSTHWPVEPDPEIIAKDARMALVGLELTSHKPLLAMVERGGEIIYLSWLTRFVTDYIEGGFSAQK